MIEIAVKRLYEPAAPQDGLRVLVDRFWPRGVRKDQLPADRWLKDAAPSPALCKWFGHDRAKWDEFKARYFAELDAQPAAAVRLLEDAGGGPLTLLYTARDIECNQAVALREYLLDRFGPAR